MKLTVAVLSLIAGCATAQTIGDIVVNSTDHTILEAAFTAADAFGLLNDPSEDLTLFAPDDAAFGNLMAAVGEEYVNAILTPPFEQHLSCLLGSHLINGTVPSSAITGPMNATSLYGTPLSLDLVDGFVTVNGNQVTALDIMASNGVVHSISNMPILPPCVTQSIADIGAANTDFSTLVALVTTAGLLEALDTTLAITLLAPTNDAFGDVPADVLTYLGNNMTALSEVLMYHVVKGNKFVGQSVSTPDEGMTETLQGDNVFIGLDTANDASFVDTNMLASNGVVHVIDTVLLPPSLVLPNFGNETTSNETTIAEIVLASESHTTLEVAVLAAPEAVLQLLSDPSQNLTLFAPDDEAFTNLVNIVGDEYVSALLTAEWSEHLFCLLAAHVVDEAISSSNITGPMNATSISNYQLSLDKVDDVVTVNGNDVTGADIMASNGIVHSISNLPILPPCVSESIVDQASANPDFSILVSLVTAAGLGDTLATTRPITLLAPTDDAFNAVPPAVLDYLNNNMTALTEVLTYHVIGSNAFFGEDYAMNEGSYTSLQGDNVTIGLEAANNASFVSTNMLASNGVIHTIDAVLLPPSLMLPDFDANKTIAEIVVESESHTTLELAVLAAPEAVLQLLNDTSRSLTLFAPDDNAFVNLGNEVGAEYVGALLTPEWSEHLFCFLAAHVVDGAVPSATITGPMNATSISDYQLSLDKVDDVVTVNGNDVTAADIIASNGVVHSISNLPILPPCVSESIVDQASANPDFSILVSLVTTAALGDTLATTRPITLLAPTNDAFDLVPAAALDYLSNNMTALTEVLTYHVIGSNAFFGEDYAMNEGSYTTLQGDNLTISSTSVNENIMFTDQNMLASNGVIHAIDTLLLPPSLVLPDFGTVAPTSMAPTSMAPTTAAPVPSPVLSPTQPPNMEEEDDDDSGAIGSGSFVFSLAVGSLSFLLVALY